MRDDDGDGDGGGNYVGVKGGGPLWFWLWFRIYCCGGDGGEILLNVWKKRHELHSYGAYCLLRLWMRSDYVLEQYMTVLYVLH